MFSSLMNYFPIGADSRIAFLFSEGKPGLVVKVDVPKSRDIKKASDGKVYARRGAQNLPVDSDERLEILRRIRGFIHLRQRL